MTADPNDDPHDLSDLPDLPVPDSWALSVNDDLKRSNRLAWLVATLAALIALLEAISLMLLMPLKTVEPYTLLVDRQTGHVEALAPLKAQIVSPDAAITRSFLVQYVIARESFTSASIQDDYRKVVLLSDRTVERQYASTMSSENPASPLAYLPNDALIRTQIKSVSTLTDKRSMVRFTTRRIDHGTSTQPEQHWIAIITYEFSSAKMSEADRYINPLGFQVTSYRRDPETLPGEDIVNGVVLSTKGLGID